MYLKGKRAEDALAVANKVVEIEPAPASAQLSLANLYWESGGRRSEEEVLKVFIGGFGMRKTGPGCPVLYIPKHTDEAAKPSLKEGLNKVPEGFAVRFALSGLYLSKGRRDDAIALLKETTALKKNKKGPECVEAKNALGVVYLDQQDVGGEEILKRS